MLGDREPPPKKEKKRKRKLDDVYERWYTSRRIQDMVQVGKSMEGVVIQVHGVAYEVCSYTWFVVLLGGVVYESEVAVDEVVCMRDG